MKKSTIILIVVLVAIIILTGGYLAWKNGQSYVCKDINCSKNIGKLIGGCAGVQDIYWNECCENWAKENNIIHIMCAGNWTVENNTCVWKCNNEKVCQNDSDCATDCDTKISDCEGPQEKCINGICRSQ